MRASILRRSPLHTFCQVLSFSVLEEIYLREMIAELLSQDQAWQQRERKLNQLFLVSLMIVWIITGARRTCMFTCL